MKPIRTIVWTRLTARHGIFLQRRVFFDGRLGYIHRCYEDTFTAVLGALEAGEGVTTDGFSASEGLPHSQVNTALQFLEEYGLTERKLKVSYRADGTLTESAMGIFLALPEG